MLLDAIEAAGIRNAKEDHYYLTLAQGSDVSTGLFLMMVFVLIFLPQKKHAFRVTSGDPNRGTISLESHAAPPEGSMVQV
jgi:hypothetical protein